jgi:hypothetical protein
MPGPPSMFESLSPASAAPLADGNYVQPTLGHGLRIWWAFYWPMTVISGILVFVLNFWLRQLYEEMVLPASVVGPILKFDPYVLSYVIAFFVMYYILRKNFRRFHIALLSNRGGAGAQPLSPTIARTFRVWWTYSWRTLVYTAIAWVAVVLPMTWFVGLFKPSPVFATLFFMVLGVIIAGAVGLFAIYSNILDEDIAGFRVCVLPRQPVNASQATPAASPATH